MNAFYSVLVLLQMASALILILEAINKSHQCALLQSGIPIGKRVALVAKALAWMVIALASAGALIAPVLRSIQTPTFGPMWINPVPSVSECGLFVAFATLVVRSWVAAASRMRQAERAAKQTALPEFKNGVTG